MISKRRIEVIAFERERIVRRPVLNVCPVCERDSELLTTKQAARFVQVRTESIYRWLARGKAHGVRTPGGQHRICRKSLFLLN
jgi:excisionase family DNA binding protein